ncbi:cold-shock protein [Zafaria sp. Z1313]|uniref:cold-shock protein n=1 Tax=unclassified Zafaria TaxID=2828765 RepID=UPI002E786CBC|nr:cold shock domain-containing protein [Zafaria sp. J156]MEE1622261.1 cold shock domain-containing protein [Zafaria sp. J156]
MPFGKVKFFDANKGFGFLVTDDGESVHLPSTALPRGVTEVRPGTRMEFGIAQGRKGAQALSARVVESAPSVVRAKRRPAEETAVLIEDLIKWLDGVSNDLHKGRYPEKQRGAKIAAVLRAVADDLEA